LSVRLFIGNLPYGASEADLRAHFATVAEPTHIVMPVDRETGRPRGFAFVEFTERAAAEEVIKRFDAQPFQGRSLAVSEARAREDRPPGGFSPRPPGGGFSSPRPGGGGFGGPRPGGGGFGAPRFGPPGGAPAGPGGRDRTANFGPPAPPKRLRGAKKNAQQDNRPRGPIKERSGGRIYAVDDLEGDDAIDLDGITAADDLDAVTPGDPDATTANEPEGDQDDE
jgi:RNA recognition motif-containing protein